MSNAKDATFGLDLNIIVGNMQKSVLPCGGAKMPAPYLT
jgi:hypothetical protein